MKTRSRLNLIARSSAALALFMTALISACGPVSPSVDKDAIGTSSSGSRLKGGTGQYQTIVISGSQAPENSSPAFTLPPSALEALAQNQSVSLTATQLPEAPLFGYFVVNLSPEQVQNLGAFTTLLEPAPLAGWTLSITPSSDANTRAQVTQNLNSVLFFFE